MSYCSPYSKGNILYYLDENKLFSCITTFTFVVIGIFWYILKCYTFFQRHKIPAAVRPSAPYGNVEEVLCHNTNLYVYLWKYYNKFKRKGQKFGGFFVFLKPCILVVHPSVTFKVLSEETVLEDAYRKRDLKHYRKVVKIFSDDLLEQILVKSSALKFSFMENGSFEKVLHYLVADLTFLTFGFDKSLMAVLNAAGEKKTRSNFSHYLRLVLPLLQKRTSHRESRKIIKNTRVYRKKLDIRENDVLQHFFDNAEDDDKSEEILDEIMDISVENNLQTFSSVLFSLYELAVNPEIQDDLIGEIRRFNRDNRSLNLDNLHHMIYLEAVVKETLRKYPPVPLVVKRPKKNYDMSEFGVNIPKNCLIFATIFGIHHDPANYADPESFDPDRFFEDNIKYIKPNTYLPFGLDSKKNIGFKLTTVFIKLCIFNILSKYRVNLTNPDYTLEFDNHKLSTSPKQPLPLKFEMLDS